MENIYIRLRNKKEIILEDGVLTLKNSIGLNFCPSDKVENYILQYWKESNGGVELVINNDHMDAPLKIIASKNDKYKEDVVRLYEVMREFSNNVVQKNSYRAITYKTVYQNVRDRDMGTQTSGQIGSTAVDNQACCPRCGSTSLSANKKGFGVGRATVGTLAFGLVPGLLIGSAGSKKIEVTCLKCGKKFKV